MSDNLKFGEYLLSSNNSMKSSEALGKELTAEEKLDEDRSQRINDIFKQYEKQAKKTEELLKESNVEKESIKDSFENNEQFMLGDIGQFVNELNEDMSLNKESTLEKTPEVNQQIVSFRSDNNKKMRIDLFGVQKSELNKKAAIYKKRQMSPAVPAHERLFAKAMENDAKAKLRQVSTNKKQSCKPLTNKLSNELTKDREPGTTPNVIFSNINSCFTKISLNERRKLNKSYYK